MSTGRFIIRFFQLSEISFIRILNIILNILSENIINFQIRPAVFWNLLKRLNPEVDLSIEIPGVDLLAPMWASSNGVFGWQDESRWVNFANWMGENGMLSSSGDPNAAFDNSFVANAQ